MRYKPTLLLLILFSMPLQVMSSDKAIENKGMSCVAKHLDTNKLVAVKTISSITENKIASAQWPLGYPTIAINDRAFIKLPKNAKHFVYYHECAHLMLMSNDEQRMDCESIRLLIARQGYSKIKIRVLVNTLSQEFGLSKRWSNLLACEDFQNAD